MSAIFQGYLAIPILPFELSNRFDYQLSLIENYLHKNMKNLVSCVLTDFKFLTKNVMAEANQQYSF
jgi:hypothetical protein